MKKIISLTVTLIFMAVSVCFAHSGRTDVNGGHRDIKNKSGLGYYHYHCGGHEAHLHKAGVCPYDNIELNYIEVAEKKAKQYLFYSDTKCLMDGNELQAYVLNGTTYVKCADLNNYGFSVNFIREENKVIITRDYSKKANPLELVEYPSTKEACEVLDSSIKIYGNMNGREFEFKGINGNGNMFVEFSELAFFAFDKRANIFLNPYKRIVINTVEDDKGEK